MTWAAWILAAAWPVVVRVLIALGMGVVTYAGLRVAVSAALDAARGALSGLLGDVVQIMALAGFFQALGIIAGALMAVVALRAVKKLGFLTKGA